LGYRGNQQPARIKQQVGQLHCQQRTNAVDDASPHPAFVSHSPSELLNSTENPLWIDKYVKPYEEQELSMRVAPDLESPIRMGGASNNASGADQANPYATIQKPRRALPSIHLGEEMGESSDYATIGGSSPNNKYPTSRDTQIILAVSPNLFLYLLKASLTFLILNRVDRALLI
jgi:hypothetical protein